MARVTTKGQITLPKKVREALGVRPGDQVEFEKQDGDFILKKKVEHSPFAKWRGFLKNLKGRNVDELIKEMRGR